MRIEARGAKLFVPLLFYRLSINELNINLHLCVIVINFKTMPFTFSHPALVLPLTALPKKTYSLTGLIVGSAVPDFEYFIRMNTSSIYSHTWLGVLWFDIPFGIALCFLYHQVVRDMLIHNLPQQYFRRFVPFTNSNFIEYFRQNYFTVIISIAVGAVSHIIWDGFTHYDGIFVPYLLWLEKSITILGYPVFIYQILQHLSTIVGGVIILWVLLKFPKTDFSEQRKNKQYWPILFGITSITLLLRAFLGSPYELIDYLIIAAMTGSMSALIITPLLIKNLKIVVIKKETN